MLAFRKFGNLRNSAVSLLAKANKLDISKCTSLSRCKFSFRLNANQDVAKMEENRISKAEPVSKKLSFGKSYVITYPEGGHDASTPVVLILGWTGSTPKQLLKYGDLYKSWNCIVLCYTHPVVSVYFRHPNAKIQQKTSERLVEVLDKSRLGSNPLLIHLFCNGGFFIYKDLALLLEGDKNRVLGAIFDSSPVYITFYLGYNALFGIPALTNSFLKALAVLIYLPIYAKMTIQRMTGQSELNKGYRILTESQEHTWPHLFLYSDADVVAPPQYVTAFAEKRKKANTRLVQTHNFGDSPHVQHFLRYPEAYSENVQNFFRECLAIKERLNSSDQAS